MCVLPLRKEGVKAVCMLILMLAVVEYRHFYLLMTPSKAVKKTISLTSTNTVGDVLAIDANKASSQPSKTLALGISSSHSACSGQAAR